MESQIKLTSQFQRAFDILENTNENLFITGSAGTGKSTFLEYYRGHTGKNVVVLAPTGVAALNVKGQTIHSFFRFKPRFIDPSSIVEKRNKRPYNKIDLLIIDEISMVRADIFDAIERFLRLNGKKRGELFGGVQICVIGDLFQLPPIVGREEMDIFSQVYDSPYFFDSKCFEDAGFGCVKLDKVFRQSDNEFIHVLNDLRTGDVTQDTIDFINRRAGGSLHLDTTETPIVLTTRNDIADRTNIQKMAEIRTEGFTYKGVFKAATGQQKAVGDARLPAPIQLNLKVGAQVMLTKNDSDKRWVNGTIGVIKELHQDKIIVSVKTATGQRSYNIKKEKWETVRYRFDEAEGKVIEDITDTYKQYPLIPAWAVTIHKSQGKTLDAVIIDLGRGAFAPGQLYVALSRARNFDKIVLRSKITQRDVICDPRIVTFARQFL